MTDPFANMRFARIETRGVMPNGKIVTSWRSYPLGVGKGEYDRINADMVRLYGNGVRVVGTPMGHPSLGVERSWHFPMTDRPVLAEGEIAIVRMIVADDDEIEVMGVNRTLDGAIVRILDDVAKRLEEDGDPLTDGERSALTATLVRDWTLQLDGDIVSPADIEDGRLLEIGACVGVGYEIGRQTLGD